LFVPTIKRHLSPVPVAHSCNFSYSGSRTQEDHSLKPAWANIPETLSWKCPTQKRVSWEHLPSKCKALSSNSLTSKKDIPTMGKIKRESPCNAVTVSEASKCLPTMQKSQSSIPSPTKRKHSNNCHDNQIVQRDWQLNIKYSILTYAAFD
jgi:hypothetical protein